MSRGVKEQLRASCLIRNSASPGEGREEAAQNHRQQM
jgi:hypothetical protein